MPAASSVTVALDAMGGDFGPSATVEAAAAMSRETTIRIQLVGHPDRIKAELDRHEHRARAYEIVPALEVVGMSEKPREALAGKAGRLIAVALSRGRFGRRRMRSCPRARPARSCFRRRATCR